MPITLTKPWQDHPAGATINLSEFDERQLVRANVAVYSDGVVEDTAPELILPLTRNETGALVAQVAKPATVPWRKGKKG